LRKYIPEIIEQEENILLKDAVLKKIQLAYLVSLFCSSIIDLCNIKSVFV